MRKAIIAALLAVCGLLAAYTLTAQASGPVTIPDLPGLGYSLSMQYNVGTGCGLYVVIGGNGVTQDIPIGDIPPACVPASEQQARIDQLLRDYPPPGQAPVTTTVWATMTVQADPVTVTLPPMTLPSMTTTETVTTTLPGERVEVPVDRVQTVTETVTVPAAQPADLPAPLDPAWLTALAARSQALNDLYGLN